MKVPTVTEVELESFDGTRLAYHTSEPPAEAAGKRTILLCNGLGGSWKAWTHQIRYLGDRYRFVSWDYRGLYRSSAPAHPDALTVHDHARDGLAVLEDATDDDGQVAIFGWSMGVQVALEMFRLAPERLKSLVLINGVSGNPWASVMNLRAMNHLLPPIIRGVGSIPRIAEAVTRRLVTMPETIQWAKRIGLAANTLDDEIFADLAGSFADLDMGIYMRVLELLGEHDASMILRDIDIPVLVISGARDHFTPRVEAERMARRVPGAEILIVPGGTHYVAVEYPDLVNLRIEKFFRERGFGET